MSVRVFLCYAHEDEALKRKLEKQLKVLKRQGLIDMWHDRDITAGADGGEEIAKHLDTAEIVLLLISPDFMASDYCYDTEMKRAMNRHHLGDTLVIPVILRPVDWQGSPFGKLQALPTDAIPITRWSNKDEAFLSIAQGIRILIKERKDTLAAYDEAVHSDSAPVAEEIQKAVEQLTSLKDQTVEEGKAFMPFNKREHYEKVLAAYEQAAHIDPSYASTYHSIGLTLIELQRYDEALDAFDKAIRLDPNYVAAYSAKGFLLDKLQRYDEAFDMYDQAIRLNPNYTPAYSGKAFALDGLQRYDEAFEVFDQAIRLNPNDTMAIAGKGDIFKHLKRYDEALNAYEQAIRLDPKFTIAYSVKAKVLLDLKRYDEALTAYDVCIRLDPKHSGHYFNKGFILFILNRNNEALVAFEQTARLDPNYSHIYFAIGQALFFLQRYDKAITAYDEAIRLDPDDSFIQYNRALALAKLEEKNAES